jgi:hypothetical protein
MQARDEDLGNYLECADDFTYVDMEGLEQNPSLAVKHRRAHKKSMHYHKNGFEKTKAHRGRGHRGGKAMWSVYQDDDFTKRFGASIDEAGRETEQWVEHDAESKEAFEWLAKNH